MRSFEQKLSDAWPPQEWRDVGVLVAVSGGADSVALLRALAAIRDSGEGRLLVAHFNHALRGTESDEDARFVEELCWSLSVPAVVERATTILDEARGGVGLESAARDARYSFLQTTAEKLGARYIVTAHTADDQAETILQRILRGTGIAGLSGIPRSRNLGPAATLIRPLLEFRRTEVRAYLDELGQSHREDSSNHDRDFSRNRIRNELLPLLMRDYSATAVENLLRLARAAAGSQAAIEPLLLDLEQRAIRSRSKDEVLIDCAALTNVPLHLVRELFVRLWKSQAWPARDMDFERWDQLARLAQACSSTQWQLTSSTKSLTLPAGISAKTTRTELVLRKGELS